MSELIAAGTSYAASADFTVLAGDPTSLFIKPASGNAVAPGGVQYWVQHKTSDGLYNTVLVLDASNITEKGTLWMPGTFRVLRQPASASTGMDLETSSGGSGVTATQGNAGTAAQAWFTKVVDSAGVNVATVKAANTAPAATDTSIVVAMSQNSPTVLAQAAATAGQLGELVLAACTTAAPTDVTGNSYPLSLTTGGGLRVDLASAVGTALAVSTGAAANALRVQQASTAIAQQGHGPTGSAVPSGATQIGGVAATSNPANASNGNLTGAMVDKAGRLVTTTAHIRENTKYAYLALAASGETTLIAQTASEFHDIAMLIISTAGAAAATITLRDGTSGTTVGVFNYPDAALAPSGGPLVLCFNPPLPAAAANTNWTVQNSVTTATNITAVYIKNL
jgi:hypothetical protein